MGFFMVDIKLSGYKTVAMFMHYVHADETPVKNAADRVVNWRRADS